MRQLLRLRDVRAPAQPNADSLTQAQVRQTASTAEDMEQYNSAVISQVRLVAGSQAWTQPPAPAPTGSPTNANGYPVASGREVLGEILDGDKDGINMIFQMSHYGVPQTVKVFYNSLRLGFGETQDYVVEEATPGQGYIIVRLTGAIPPRARDRLWVDYTQA